MLRTIGPAEALVLLVFLAVVGVVFVWIRKAKGFTVMGTVLWAWALLMSLAFFAKVTQTNNDWLSTLCIILAGVISYQWVDIERRREATGPWRRFGGTILLIFGTSMIAVIPNSQAATRLTSGGFNLSTFVLQSVVAALSLVVGYVLSFRKTYKPMHVAVMGDAKSFRAPQTKAEKVGWWIGSLVFRKKKATTAPREE